MRTIQAEVPDSIYQQALELSERERIPLDRLLSFALAQALGAWKSQDVISVP